ncbi:hypothetical protein [Acetobacter conturbans]|uniref:Terminase small subunit n=1 Tax=Acetobacter conturbans TaxID=1737472 RepID=A0ABX0K3R5_9PROT|nr:hypothetical protein [Acetobacter conturbans]NHN89847.1 hypothetical protein [Acetobacter conturbans]
MPPADKTASTGRKSAPAGTSDLAALRAEMREMREAQERFVVVGERIITMLSVINDKADLLIEAATKEPGPSPVAKMLEAILAALAEQHATLSRLPAELAAAIHEDEDAESEPADPAAWHEPDDEE